MIGNGFRKLFMLVLAAVLVAPVLLAGCGGSSPEDAVKKYQKAAQESDWEALKSSVAPQRRELTKEQEELTKIEFEQVKVIFDEVKMQTVYSEEDEKKAAVVMTEGKITYTANLLGEEKTETKDISKLSKEERTYETVEVDGVWYVDKDLP